MLKRIFTRSNIYIGLFLLLYACIALISAIHAVAFFNLANTMPLSVVLAVTFEVGQAAVLFSILTNPNDRKRIMTWCLMCLLTLVQILGNVFSSYKYLIQNSSENLRFFKEPIFIWTSIPDNMANVIVTYIVGAILPVVSLALTAMVSNYLNDKKQKNQPEQPPVEESNPQEESPSVEEEKPIEEQKKSHFINL